MVETSIQQAPEEESTSTILPKNSKVSSTVKLARSTPIARKFSFMYLICPIKTPIFR